MTVGWSSERISKTVTQTYVEKELGSRKYQDILHQVLAFGDGLTDDTYLDWILERSPRFFLILNDIGLPEKIFEIIDRSFDDDDLPLSQDALWELNLFGTTSETLENKFFRQQFHYQVQELEPGGHVDYGSWNVVPVEASVKKPGIASSTPSTDRVFTQDHLYTRKKIPASGENGIDRIRFIMHLKNIHALQHRHLVSVWATYSQNDFNYVLLQPSCDITLKHILEDKDQAKQFKCLEKHERRQTLITWMHCLTSGLAYLHSRGFMHKNIRPSTISVDHNNIIYLNDYNALRVLDVDEPPNSYSGEVYDHAAPENWQRKPCLHETAPLKTYLPGGGRTTRRLPKTPSTPPDSRRPSLTGQDNLSRTQSRSQNSSSGSSMNIRPRNALITTFAPPETTPASLPNKYFPADIFSLTTVLITLISYILGHSPKSFASHRSRLNRQAGRGNAPPDSSFHKNLKQVEKWIDSMAKEAGQKEKKDQKLWGAIVELVGLCREGLHKDPEDRISTFELEKKTLGWVDWGIGRRRKCSCSEEDRAFSEPAQPNPVLSAQRDSVLSWSKISERLSEGQDGDSIPAPPSLYPRRSLSKRLSTDRNPERRRSKHQRPIQSVSSASGGFSSIDDALEEEPVSPSNRRQSEITRSAVRQAVAATSPQQSQGRQSSGDAKTVIHQGRSAYRARTKKAQTIPGLSSRHMSKPIQHAICEEELTAANGEDLALQEPPSAKALKLLGQSATVPPDAESAYTLTPRKSSLPSPSLTRPPSRAAPHRLPRLGKPQQFKLSGKEKDENSIFGKNELVGCHNNKENHMIIQGIPLSPSEEDLSSSAKASYKSTYDTGSEVWGLGTALEEEEVEKERGEKVYPPNGEVMQSVEVDVKVNMEEKQSGSKQLALEEQQQQQQQMGKERMMMEFAQRGSQANVGRKRERAAAVNVVNAVGGKSDEGMVKKGQSRGPDWPLPLGTLTFEEGMS